MRAHSPAACSSIRVIDLDGNRTATRCLEADDGTPGPRLGVGADHPGEPNLVATQISSAGHLLAHSAVT